MRVHHGVNTGGSDSHPLSACGGGAGPPGGQYSRGAQSLLLLPAEEPGPARQGTPLGPQSPLRTPERPTQGAGVARRWSQAQVGSGPGHQALTD